MARALISDDHPLVEAAIDAAPPTSDARMQGVETGTAVVDAVAEFAERRGVSSWSTVARTPPRYFVAQPGAAEPRASDPGQLDVAAAVAHVVDVLHLLPDGAPAFELIVGVDLRGRLLAVPGSERHQLSPRAAAELSHHELATGGQPRRVRANSLWLLDAQDLEVPEGEGGLLDPVALHGVLLGPLPGQPQRLEGQLLCGRADLVWRFVEEAEEAFRFAGGGRCLHFTLAAGRADEIAAGESVVVAYPLPPAELCLEQAANDEEVLLLVYELLVALDEGLCREGLAGLGPMPVPSRSMLEHRLRAHGWEIEGDRAVRRGQARGWRRLFGAEQQDLPPEGSLDEYLHFGREALARIPGWPDDRARALADRLSGTMASASAARAFTTNLPIARAVEPLPAPPPVTTPAATLPADWRRDFDPQPQPEPDSTPAPTPAPATEGSRPRPDWMRDFD